MALLTGIPTMSFIGVSFAVKADAPMQTHHAEDTLMVEDVLIDGGITVDISANVLYDSMTITAVFETEVARNALAAKRGFDGTFTNIQGESWQSFLKKVKKETGDSGELLLTCEFRRLS